MVEGIETSDRQSPDLIHSIYNRFVRPRLPYKISVLNGVAVRGVVRLLDSTDTLPDYEDELIESICDYVTSGDSVVVIGGGFGVSSVIASHQAGEEGSVTTFEGSKSQVACITETLELNRPPTDIDLRHTIVGSFNELSEDWYGAPEGANILPPAELPTCDVLVMDCEGAEIQILDEMEIMPRAIVVETHGFLDASEEDVRARLEDRGYHIQRRATEDEDDGVIILSAVHPGVVTQQPEPANE